MGNIGNTLQQRIQLFLHSSQRSIGRSRIILKLLALGF